MEVSGRIRRRSLLAGVALLTFALSASAASARDCETGKSGAIRSDAGHSEELIVMSAFDGNDYEILAMAPDGGGLHALTNNTEDEYYPRISPDGTRIVFSRRPREFSPHEGIFTMSINGLGTTKIVDHAGRDWHPAWTPNGRIVFTSDRSGNWNLYIKTIGRHGARRLAGARGFSPDVSSSDPRKVVFERRERKHHSAPWILDLVSGKMTSLGLPTGYYPRWSPDGRVILFEAGCCVDPEPVWTDLYTVMPGARRVDHVEPNEPLVYHRQGDWSPDGTRIAFLVQGDQDGDPTDVAVAEFPDTAGTEHIVRRVGIPNTASGWNVSGLDWGRVVARPRVPRRTFLESSAYVAPEGLEEGERLEYVGLEASSSPRGQRSGR